MAVVVHICTSLEHNVNFIHRHTTCVTQNVAVLLLQKVTHDKIDCLQFGMKYIVAAISCFSRTEHCIF